MRKNICFCIAVTLLAFALSIAPKAYSYQGGVITEIKLKDGRPISVYKEIIRQAWDAVKPAEKADKQAQTVAKGETNYSDLVTSLAKQFKLGRKGKINPHLVFGEDEIEYWEKQRLDEHTLKLEFAARRIILDAAEKQNVPIRDQDMLSDAANQIIAAIRKEEGSDKHVANNGNSQLPRPNINELICKGATSQELIKQAWDALEAGKGGRGPDNFEKALACAGIVIDKWGDEADEQQVKRQNSGDCKKTPTAAEKDAYFRDYWALSDIAAAWFIRGQSYTQLKRCSEARESFEVLIKKYNCAYTWDPQGWFWNTAKGAAQESKHCP